MLIDKDCKTSIVRPLPDYISRIARYMPYRSKAMDNLKLQVSGNEEDKHTPVCSPYTSKPHDIRCEQNIQALIKAATANSLLVITDSNRGLMNPFTNKQATVSQQHDLLNFRSIGQKDFLMQIAAVVPVQPSVHEEEGRVCMHSQNKE